MSPTSIAVDVMGGDDAPESILDGVKLALDEYKVRLVLAGPEELIRESFSSYEATTGSYEIRPASEHIRMDENPLQGVRKKKDSSLVQAANSVKEGQTRVLISAGNTGAVMACTKIKWGVRENVDRPAIATHLPNREGSYSILIDSGANVDCTARQLLQFAMMGVVFSETVTGIENPSVGLLNVGTEVKKGNELVQEAYELFEQGPINFHGNVEGSDVLGGTTDVIVCDGFVGNVALKLSEGVARTIFEFMKEQIDQSVRNKIGGWMLKPAFKQLKKIIDPAEYGGAPLLGLNEGCIICHGSSSPKAIKNAVRQAMLFIERDCNSEIGNRMNSLNESVTIDE
ncbi:MAG: phosphate acyltransferase PlsX [bacterium]